MDGSTPQPLSSEAEAPTTEEVREKAAEEVLKDLDEGPSYAKERLANDLILALREAESRVKRGLAGARELLKDSLVRKNTKGEVAGKGAKPKSVKPAIQAILQVADSCEAVLDVLEVVRQAESVVTRFSFTQNTLMSAQVRALRRVMQDRGLITDAELKEATKSILKEDEERAKAQVEISTAKNLDEAVAQAQEGAKERTET